MSHDQNKIAHAIKASHLLAGRSEINKVGKPFNRQESGQCDCFSNAETQGRAIQTNVHWQIGRRIRW